MIAKIVSSTVSASQRSTRTRAGVSLMEVLISIFVLTVGLLGMAAMIPIGGIAMQQVNKADRVGACGRAGLRDVKVRRMLEPRLLVGITQDKLKDMATTPYAIDPLGVLQGNSQNLGPLKRYSLASFVNPTTAMQRREARQVFVWPDDIAAQIDQGNPAKRPELQMSSWSDANAPFPKRTGAYSWFITVCPADSEMDVMLGNKTTFVVSVVVCQERKYGNDAVKTVGATFLGAGISGGSIRLDSPQEEIGIGQWIMLTDGIQCKWYRIVTAGDSPTDLLTLDGPDWDTAVSMNPQAVIVNKVVGVYTTTVSLDKDPAWYDASMFQNQAGGNP